MCRIKRALGVGVGGVVVVVGGLLTTGLVCSLVKEGEWGILCVSLLCVSLIWGGAKLVERSITQED